MTVSPVLSQGPASAGSDPRHSPLAQRAVGLSALCGLVFAASIATFGIAYAIGGASATEDNWVGLLVASMALVGLLGALAAFVLAIMATVKQERWALLWLPLGVFPALLLFVVLGEAFWWE